MLRRLLCTLSLSVAALCASAQDTATPIAERPGDAANYRSSFTAETTRRVLHWSGVALDAIARDHARFDYITFTPLAEQLGPTRSSRALAIVHIAMFDAANAIKQRYPSYSGIARAPYDTSADAAIAQAAHDTLAALYPAQRRYLASILADELAQIPSSRAKWNGIDLGRRAAAAILALRANDGSYHDEPVVGQDYPYETTPGEWRPDPVSRIDIAFGAWWGRVRPFVIASPSYFRGPVHPALASMEYAVSLNEVKRLGGNGTTTPTQRTPEQTMIGIYWAYDNTPWVGTPPRAYGRIAAQIAQSRITDPVEMTRMLALVHAAIADAAITVWYQKYIWDLWRPVTAIREASPGSGPTGLGDGNPYTQGDPAWTPLGSPASNIPGFPNFTPPFPSYTSGHSGLGGALFQMLRRYYGTDSIAFSFVSDEYNGVTRDNQGRVRPRLVRSFANLTQAEMENGQSRVYLGVHFPFDVSNGINTGHQVADYVFRRGLLPPAR